MTSTQENESVKELIEKRERAAYQRGFRSACIKVTIGCIILFYLISKGLLG